MTDLTQESRYEVVGITKQDYARAKHYVVAIESISRITYESIYIIDYFHRSFMYISSNPLFLCGLSPEEVKEMKFNFYNQHVLEEDLEWLRDINLRIVEFFNSQPFEDRASFTISYDFRLTHNGEIALVNHRLTPLALDRKGNVWLALCHVSLSNNDKPGNIEIRKIGNANIWRYNPTEDSWRETPKIKLTTGEREVLMLSAKGLTMNEIAYRIGKSRECVKSRKRTIFQKLGVRSITEAYAFATKHNLM